MIIWSLITLVKSFLIKVNLFLEYLNYSKIFITPFQWLTFLQLSVLNPGDNNNLMLVLLCMRTIAADGASYSSRRAQQQDENYSSRRKAPTSSHSASPTLQIVLAWLQTKWLQKLTFLELFRCYESTNLKLIKGDELLLICLSSYNPSCKVARIDCPTVSAEWFLQASRHGSPSCWLGSS